MKNSALTIMKFLMIFILIVTFNFVNAQSESNISSIAAIAVQSSVPPSVNFTISIPTDYSSRIIRENGDNACYFKFRKTDGTTVFLFQVNKISEIQWISVKEQLANPIILDHKNGFIYYAQTTDKSRIKGPDADSYEQVYGSLRQLISSIVITDGEIQ